MANPPQNPKDPVIETSIRLAKISFILVGIASIVFPAVKFSAPYCVDLLSFDFPCPLIAIQLIIILIWKLADRRPEDDQASLPDRYHEIFPALDEIPLPDIPPESVPTAPESGDLPPERCCISSDPDPKDPRVSSAVGIEEATESIDDTWRAICGGAAPARRVLRKSDTWQAAPPSSPPAARKELKKSATFRAAAEGGGWRRREMLVVNRDELSGRAEAFIEMHYHSLRLQRQESEQRQILERVNHAY